MKSTLLTKDLMSLESYAREREAFHAEVMAHRSDRTVRVGRNATLIFEDELTVRYQIQETLSAGGISADEAVQVEIDAYAPLIPDGSNLKATFKFEFADASERSDSAAKLAELAGVENRVWTRVDNSSQIFGMTDEDMDRAKKEQASAVHFLRFDLEKPMIRDLKQGRPLMIGIDHPAYNVRLVLNDNVRRSLLKDLR